MTISLRQPGLFFSSPYIRTYEPLLWYWRGHVIERTHLCSNFRVNRCLPFPSNLCPAPNLSRSSSFSLGDIPRAFSLPRQAIRYAHLSLSCCHPFPAPSLFPVRQFVTSIFFTPSILSLSTLLFDRWCARPVSPTLCISRAVLNVHYRSTSL